MQGIAASTRACLRCGQELPRSVPAACAPDGCLLSVTGATAARNCRNCSPRRGTARPRSPSGSDDQPGMICAVRERSSHGVQSSRTAKLRQMGAGERRAVATSIQPRTARYLSFEDMPCIRTGGRVTADCRCEFPCMHIVQAPLPRAATHKITAVARRSEAILSVRLAWLCALRRQVAQARCHGRATPCCTARVRNAALRYTRARHPRGGLGPPSSSHPSYCRVCDTPPTLPACNRWIPLRDPLRAALTPAERLQQARLTSVLPPARRQGPCPRAQLTAGPGRRRSGYESRRRCGRGCS